jgi:hypothetical protein
MERMDVLGHGSAFGFQNMKSTAELVFNSLFKVDAKWLANQINVQNLSHSVSQ